MKAFNALIYEFFLLIVIAAILPGCNQVVDPMQNFTENMAPSIISFTDDLAPGTEIVPGMTSLLTVEAHDPEGEALRFEFSSADGSFSDQLNTADGSTVIFHAGSHIIPLQPVSVRVTVRDDRRGSASQEIVLGTTADGPAITSIGDIPAYIRSDGQAHYTFTANTTGLYQVQVLDNPGATAVFNPALSSRLYCAGDETVVTIDGPSWGGMDGDAELTASPPDRVAILLMDSLGSTGTAYFVLNVDDAPPASTVNPPDGHNSMTAFTVTITASDALSGVSRISYTVNGADPDFSGTGTVIMGSTADVAIGSAGNGTYTLRYRAMDAAGNIEAVRTAVYTVATDITPPSDVDLWATLAGNHSITIEWTRPPEPDFDHALITWEPGGTEGVSVDKEITTHIITGCATGVEYTITARAVDTFGNTSAGVSIVITPPSSALWVTYINNAEELYNCSMTGTHWGDYLILTADLDLSAYAAGAGWNPIGNSTTHFTGVFDGGGHTITGLTINRTTAEYQGLFGYIDNGTVMNLNLAGVNVQGYVQAGALAGLASESTIRNCNVTSGTIYGDTNVGGLAGNIVISGLITGCSTNVTVNGYNYTGGLVGHNRATISYSSARGPVTGNLDYIGGLVGYHDSGTIEYCFATGTVNGDQYVGGLAGYLLNGTTVQYCFATGNVDGDQYVGGLAGRAYGNILNCYARGNVHAANDYIGGLAGWSTNSVYYCYSTGAVSFDPGPTAPFIGGLIGYSGAPTIVLYDYYDRETSLWQSWWTDLGDGKTTLEMKQQATFVGWDFGTIWNISGLNNSYPHLRGNLPP